MRVLIRAWREKAYPDYHRPQPAAAAQPTDEPPREKSPEELQKEAEAKFTANQLLLHYDFAYWLRSMNFIRRKVDALYRLRSFQLSELNDGVVSEEERIISRLKKTGNDKFDYLALPNDQKDVIHQRLMHVRAELREAYKQLRIEGRKLQARYKEEDKDTIAAKIKAIPLGIEQVRWLLGLPLTSTDSEPDYSKLDEDECLARAKELLSKPEFEQKFTDAARALRTQLIEKVVDPTYKKGRALFRPPNPVPDGLDVNETIWIVIQKYLWRYFSQFDDFDQIGFPILYGIEEGESDVVEVIRISPEDATKLINERKEKKTSADGVGRRKLAGTALHHFGAFLDRSWRQNDIMWGRLDGAERLITALLPDPKDKGVRDEMIKQAHSAILIEEMPKDSRDQLNLLMSNALIRAGAGDPMNKTIENLVKELALIRRFQRDCKRSCGTVSRMMSSCNSSRRDTK